MDIQIEQSIPTAAGYAAERTRGLYNVDADDGSTFRLSAQIPIEDTDWQIGVVVGPSGSGKSSIGRALHDHGWAEWTGGGWSKTDPIIEVLGSDDYAKATAALSAVGLGSVPSWLRPYHVLSTGESFRADMAALLLDDATDVYIDEFTSVLDRRVAQVAAGAFAKTWRRKKGRRIVLLTCHYDVLEWLQPDWVLDTASGLHEFAEDRGVVQAQVGRFPVGFGAGFDGPLLGEVIV
jgi:ABC-type lipoprotein export system ATPase subunit